MNKRLLIAVDGYSSCGKSSFAKEIAKEMNYIYVDSGAMYRTITLFCLKKNLISEGKIIAEELIRYLPDISIEFRYNADTGMDETYLNGENVEEEIRTMEVSKHVSAISVIGEVRKHMVEMQRRISMQKGIVMDGRDIGTVVFPDADLKIFMTAAPEIRAKRRYDELISKGIAANFDEIMQNITNRDRIDSAREISPLIKAEDALLLDNSYMTVREQLDWFRDIIKKRFNED